MSASILCIEDDEDTQELLVEFLTGHGYDVQSVNNGQDGLIAIMSNPPDLVLCDISMPQMSGFELLERLASLDPDQLGSVPFVFLTALTDRETALRGRRLGADDYVTKPIDFELLIEIVKIRLCSPGRLGRIPAKLTPREVEALTWVARGKSSTDIATLLCLSDRTVDFHIENAMRKLGVATRVQAAIKARMQGTIKC
ncbi:MAG: response regulator transcription factor [Alphaproteobacteria bacterium]|nr:response regulator transcription factor [Alphaproteobacteria bacterium]